MSKDNIKKLLYVDNPKANLIHIRKGNAIYSCIVNEQALTFSVPVSDMGDATFGLKMEAKLLVRWLV